MALRDSSLNVYYYPPVNQSRPKIDIALRNGTITAISIIIGFSLSLLTQWGVSPIPWQLVDLLAVVPLIAGVLIQAWSLAELLQLESIELAFYTRAKNHFLLGGVVILIGVGVAIIIGMLERSEL